MKELNYYSKKVKKCLTYWIWPRRNGFDQGNIACNLIEFEAYVDINKFILSHVWWKRCLQSFWSFAFLILQIKTEYIHR